jgi:selenocysteine-specific elongation factor
MIVGTAGHIDHGKTTLVRALTGVETDRLKEEKVRGISIDLGFAYLPAESGAVGFVDVPGHERFIRNMLAGVTGVDFALLVVAANEGIKPQTEEHLQIIDLLGITHGVVAMTKSDLVEEARRTLLSVEIRERLRSTGLAGARIVPTSSLTGEGIDVLHRVIADAHAERLASQDLGQFRMPVDRCFSLAGAGTIVTGTVMAGQIAVGEQVVVSPDGIEAQVRSIHAQNVKAEIGRRGDRCALNLAGSRVSRQAIARGDVIVSPALHLPTDRIDVHLRLLGTERRPLSHWTLVKLHHGTTEVVARTVVLADGPLAPGEAGFVQLVLDRPTAAMAGERFIIRDASDQRTIGGGRFLDLRAPTRKRRSPERLSRLRAHLETSPVDELRSLLSLWPYYVPLIALGRDRALSLSQVEMLARYLDSVVLPQGPEKLALSKETADRLAADVLAVLEDYHRNNAELVGIGFEKLRVRLEPRLPAPAFNGFLEGLVGAKRVTIEGARVRLASHVVRLTVLDERIWQKIEPFLSGSERFRPPKVRDLSERLAHTEYDVRRVLKVLAKTGKIREVSHDHFFARDTVAEIVDILIDLAKSRSGRVTAADLRDRLDNGRKVSIELLEFFDRHGLTVRRGDFRVLNPAKVGSFGSNAQNLVAVG